MKNFPVLLKFIAGCGLLALAACDDKDPSGGDTPPQTEFTITATAITPRGATVSVSPKNQTGAYYFDVVSDKFSLARIFYKFTCFNLHNLIPLIYPKQSLCRIF